MTEAGKPKTGGFIFEDAHAHDDDVDLSPTLGDEVKYTTCYMCACRCGIKVYLQDGKVRYIQGNRDHPINKGVLCGKGSSGIMQHYSPARLQKPLKRVGPRGSGEFEEIEWDEALEIATQRLKHIRETDPKKLAFFTGRDQSQATTGWWASMFGTPNYAAHGGFCSVNMAAAGLYSIGGAFWEFGEPDWEHTKYFMMFGVAEDHDSNPIKIGLGKIKENGAKFVSINPVRTGYSAIADEWVGIRPGTDGLFVMALMHELLKAGKVDIPYLLRYTNAPWLVIQDPGAPDHGMFARDGDGHPLVWNIKDEKLTDANRIDIAPAMSGEYPLPDGRSAVPAFQLMAERYMDDAYAPEAVAEATGLAAQDIKRIAAELAHVAFEQEIELDIAWIDWAGRKHPKMIGRPVSMHAMRGISAHSNGFHTCRAIHILQMLLGSIEVPGGFRIKAPFPKPIPPTNKPTGKPDHVAPGTHLPGMALGFPTSPEDLLLDDDGKPVRLDKAYSWDFPLASHGLMHMVIHNAWAGDPYPIDTLMLFMANMSWNSSMNTSKVIEMLTDKGEDGEYKIPNIIYSDAYYSEMVPYADLVLPDTTYLERFDCISMLDRPISSAESAGDAIRYPVVQPDRDVRGFQEVLLDLGARLHLPGLVNDDGTPKYPGGYADYIVNHERQPGIGLLSGWRGQSATGNKCKGPPNPDQIKEYIAHGSFWQHEFLLEHTYYKMANKGYLEWAHDMGCVTSKEQIIFNLYSEILQSFRLAGEGHGKIQPPEDKRERIKLYFDPLPIWYTPIEEEMSDTARYPFHALTQRPMHMYHSWGSQNAWLRQIIAKNRLFIHREKAAELGIADDDWVWVSSEHGRIKVQAGLMDGVNKDTVWTWNAIGKRAGAWMLSADANESKEGFLLNHLISELLPERGDGYRYSNSDPVTGQAAWFDVRVRIEKAAAAEFGETFPRFDPVDHPKGMKKPVDISFYGEHFRKARESK
ncbi:molybdopterin oxidoreductase family protein [Varunaivibrio sulfuroxidans]|uniref:Anaerobic selenocysteine-containing dehydrogenase n=1 Tax=Varunaivibrio sulfuroxidans TaxID=1773489 RepID=A0A4R3JCR8_9PROT|nr:molybdopterin oxidoreductase family protein [Varunaivibrio sulfuroxidans]TCS62933.1 anaerobic selenocysteine-containing dehydrogenase [Varunaivibrio sulfuroxidans]WES31991.1 molybdopterin oxidoreductase family protein [Varunaivibrio sulfuroxidans]